MSDSFATWDGPRVVPLTTGRGAHTNPEDDPALLRSELAACRREIERLRERCRELADQLATFGVEAVRGRDTIANLEAERDRLRTELAEARDWIAQEMKGGTR